MKYILILSILVVFSISLVYAVEEPEESLILYMSFDTIDGKETIDHSLYGNNGEMINGPKHVKGKFGKALEFNGADSYIEIPHHESLNVDKNVTVMAWINPERIAGPDDSQWHGILAKGNNPRSYSWWIEKNSKCMHLSVGPPNGGGSVCRGGEIQINEWQHVVAQVDNGTHRYWINGQKVGEVGNKPDPPGAEDTSPVVIGTAGGGNKRYFLGMMDEVRIWNRALSEEEVNEQMEKGHFEFFAVDAQQKLPVIWGNLKAQLR